MSDKVTTTLLLDNLSLNYLVKLLPHEAIDFALRSDNKYVGNIALAEMLAAINDAIPPMNYGRTNGKPNPNNGKPHHSFDIGREYSRVVYVAIVKTYIKSYTDHDWKRVIDEILEAANNAGGNELSVNQDQWLITIRICWV